MKVVFVDCGAHKGQSIIKARKIYGNDIFVHSFEVIPILSEKLNKEYIDDSRIKVYNNAVWIDNSVKSIHISKTKSSWGNSLYDRFDLNDTIKIDVQCIDFTKWVSENINLNDYNILKLDIEGAEYEVLNKMMDTNTLEYFNELVGEWHDNKINSSVLKLSNIVKNRLRTEYGIDMKVWEAPWYDETTPGMVSFGQYDTPEKWARYKDNKK